MNDVMASDTMMKRHSSVQKKPEATTTGSTEWFISLNRQIY
jgi:hypothetical protein